MISYHVTDMSLFGIQLDNSLESMCFSRTEYFDFASTKTVYNKLTLHGKWHDEYLKTDKEG